MEKRLNLFLVFAVAVIVIVLLGIGEYGWKIFQQDMPFQKEVRQINGVQDIALERSFLSKTRYSIALSGAADWAKTHQELLAAAEKYEIDEEYISFSDTRGKKLEGIYNNLNFSLQEGLQRGTFKKMEQEIKSGVKQSGIEGCQLVLNDEYLYLALTDGGEELYTVMKRGGVMNEKGD